MIHIYFTTDQNNLVYPACDYSSDIVPELNWYEGEIEAPAYESHGIPRWKYENNGCVLRTAEEIQQDIDLLPVPQPTELELLRADVDFLLMMMEEE